MAFEKRSYIGKGKFYIGQVGGAALERVGNVSKAAVSFDVETKDEQDYENVGGGLANSISRIKGAGVALTLHNLNAKNLAIAIFGDASKATAGTVTDEPHVAKLGGLITLEYVNPSAVTVENSGGTITYVAGTDYTVSPAGIIILEGGAITADQAILVSYTHGADNIIEALTAAGREFVVVAEGLNEADSGKACVTQFWRVRFSPAKSLDLIGDDFATLEIEGKVLADDTRGVGESKYFRQAFL